MEGRIEAIDKNRRRVPRWGRWPGRGEYGHPAAAPQQSIDKQV